MVQIAFQNRVERIVLIQAVIGDAIIFVVVGANFSDREPVPTIIAVSKSPLPVVHVTSFHTT